MPYGTTLRITVHSPDDSQQVIEVAPQNLPLSELLHHGGSSLNTRCAGKGICDGCLVKVLSGDVKPLSTGTLVQPNEEGLIRACRFTPVTDVSIEIPQRSALGHRPSVLSDYRINIPYAHQPLVEVQQGQRAFGAAIDIGTTTVAAIIVDLSDGRISGRASGYNRQIRLGDDVVTRISLCTSSASALAQLQHAICRETLVPLLKDACSIAGIHLPDLRAISIAGNTTMLHLLTGVDPTPMGVVPFTPAFLDHRTFVAAELLNEPSLHAECHLLPGMSAYIGADITAGVLATGLIYEEGPSLLIDVGTNGEIVLKHKDRLIACATAAGPAFEGSRLHHGMRATSGAISEVKFAAPNNAIKLKTIGWPKKIPAEGVCGSGYVDFLAEAFANGLMTETGRFNRQLAGDYLEELPTQNDLLFRLARNKDDKSIGITQHDVASLLQAKAAIAAGIITLMSRCGLSAAEVKKVHLAGGFGTHMRPESAIRCGLLPCFKVDQVQPVGNTSLAGAYLALVDRSLLGEMSRLSSSAEVIELNHDPQFEDCYIDQLSIR